MSWCCCIHLTHQCDLTDFKDASQGEIRVVSGVRGSTYMCVFGVCVTCVSMQRWVWSRQCGGGAGRHNQALPVARPTAEDKNQTQWIQVHVLKKTIQSAEHLNISSEPHTDVDQWLLWTSPNLHLVTFFLSELWSHALWKHSFTSHALMNVICTASKNGRASPAALRH